MKTLFHLGWLKTAQSSKKSFKSQACRELFSEYLERIQKFSQAEIAGALTSEFRNQNKGSFLILCDFKKGSKTLSSVELSYQLDKILQGGFKSLHVAIGGADGFLEDDKINLKPDLIWSFGPMTLPHELASVVAAEQMYRGWTILRNLPYHSGH